MPENQFDFIALGDIVSDAFIRLKDAELHCDLQHADCQICMDFGAKVPYESVTVVPAVGNSPNAAVAAARLGLRSALVTDLGADDYGREALAALRSNKVDTSFVRQHQELKTNYHYVLWYADDRTILIKHEKYPYQLPALGTPRWLYLSSLGEHSLTYHETIVDYLNKNQEIKLAFQPGTFQIKIGAKTLTNLYRRSEIFFCNTDEARLILGIEAGAPIKELLTGLRALGPKIAIITDGPEGAYADDGAHRWFMPPYPDPQPPFERTGAGDAFSSTVTAALALGLGLPEALRWGPINSMSVVQKIGAQAGLLTRPELEKLLAGAPADYRPKEI